MHIIFHQPLTCERLLPRSIAIILTEVELICYQKTCFFGLDWTIFAVNLNDWSILVHTGPFLKRVRISNVNLPMFDLSVFTLNYPWVGFYIIFFFLFWNTTNSFIIGIAKNWIYQYSSRHPNKPLNQIKLTESSICPPSIQ